MLNVIPSKFTHKECVALAGKLRDVWIGAADDEPGSELVWATAMANDIKARAGQGSLMIGEAGGLESLSRRFGPLVEQALFNKGLVLDQETRNKVLPLFETAKHDANRINLMKAGGEYSGDDEAAKYPAWTRISAPAPPERPTQIF